MKKVIILLADGFETTEALAVTDILRRAGIGAETYAITGDLRVRSAQNIEVKCDRTLNPEDGDFGEADAVVLPGGLPGSHHLRDCEAVMKLLSKMRAQGKVIAAICAAPIALAAAGISQEAMGTCYPGFESEAKYKDHSKSPLCRDGKLITAQGPAMSFHLGFAIVEALEGPQKAKDIATAFLMPKLSEFAAGKKGDDAK